jgi:hypothetical protein
MQTQLPHRLQVGHQDAMSQVIPLVYDELNKLAKATDPLKRRLIEMRLFASMAAEEYSIPAYTVCCELRLAQARLRKEIAGEGTSSAVYLSLRYTHF